MLALPLGERLKNAVESPSPTSRRGIYPNLPPPDHQAGLDLFDNQGDRGSRTCSFTKAATLSPNDMPGWPPQPLILGKTVRKCAFSHRAVNCSVIQSAHAANLPCFARQILGSPSEDELGFISSDKARRYIRSLPKTEPVDFMKLWPNANPKVCQPDGFRPCHSSFANLPHNTAYCCYCYCTVLTHLYFHLIIAAVCPKEC